MIDKLEQGDPMRKGRYKDWRMAIEQTESKKVVLQTDSSLPADVIQKITLHCQLNDTPFKYPLPIRIMTSSNFLFRLSNLQFDFAGFVVSMKISQRLELRRFTVVCAWKPVLIAETDRLLPQLSHEINHTRFSLARSVSGLLQVLQVTYS